MAGLPLRWGIARMLRKIGRKDEDRKPNGQAGLAPATWDAFVALSHDETISLDLPGMAGTFALLQPV